MEERNFFSKLLTILVFGFIAVVLLIGCVKESGKARTLTFQDKVDQVASRIQKIGNNPQDFGFNSKHFDKLVKAVAVLVKSKPDYYINFLQEMVDTASRVSPTLGLQVENYASEAVRAEMAKLRQDANVAELERLRQEISDYQGKLNTAERELRKKIVEIEKLKAKIEPPPEGVSVAFFSDIFSSVGFKFINLETNRFWVGTVPAGRYSAKIKLPPGRYLVEGSQDGRVFAQKDLTVTAELSVNYNGEWYHGYVEFRNRDIRGK